MHPGKPDSSHTVPCPLLPWRAPGAVRRLLLHQPGAGVCGGPAAAAAPRGRVRLRHGLAVHRRARRPAARRRAGPGARCAGANRVCRIVVIWAQCAAATAAADAGGSMERVCRPPRGAAPLPSSGLETRGSAAAQRPAACRVPLLQEAVAPGTAVLLNIEMFEDGGRAPWPEWRVTATGDGCVGGVRRRRLLPPVHARAAARVAQPPGAAAGARPGIGYRV